MAPEPFRKNSNRAKPSTAKFVTELICLIIATFFIFKEMNESIDPSMRNLVLFFDLLLALIFISVFAFLIHDYIVFLKSKRG
ncbi:hypothetical protein JZO70_05280 [Enterococcus sp. 669A]|uniref:Uncharacterized protein n=1 Tax=Candidatus Enterococcus moelleringii TaxID=2815325 RepID=A0ABS3L7F3_9ENTE|nr:hypothetical protein [Enterococcus sp. 669A]MBO1305560.1 hypothetical protein [Enterococcus sp. 669A]